MRMLSRVQFFVTSWTVARQAPLSMGFSRQEYWSGLPFLPPGDLPNPVIELSPPALQVDSFPLSHQGRPPATAKGVPLQLMSSTNHKNNNMIELQLTTIPTTCPDMR